MRRDLTTLRRWSLRGVEPRDFVGKHSYMPNLPAARRRPPDVDANCLARPKYRLIPSRSYSFAFAG